MARKIVNLVSPLGSILLGKKKKSAAPEAGPQVMPLPDDEKVRLARKRSLAQQMARGGRQSTILSDTDTLG